MADFTQGPYGYGNTIKAILPTLNVRVHNEIAVATRSTRVPLQLGPTPRRSDDRRPSASPAKDLFRASDAGFLRCF